MRGTTAFTICFCVFVVSLFINNMVERYIDLKLKEVIECGK